MSRLVGFSRVSRVSGLVKLGLGLGLLLVLGLGLGLVFTARRSYASALLGVVILSVRPSVRLSVTRVLCD